MKPRGPKPKTVYRIIDRATEEAEGAYSRGYGDVFDFNAPSTARRANCHDIYEDKEKYRIDRYRVIYELIEEGCDD